ncbi:hypothetical protein IJC60_05870 [bacterium]|nr:hypothetical protein [bacterium]
MNQYFSRWYDKDPVLSMSMRTLSTSDDATQISVALNLIKIIIEHSIQEHEFNNVEDIVDAVENGIIQRGNCRWYDIDSTVRTAIQMLEKCSPATRQKVAIDMAQLVIEKIIQDDDMEDDSIAPQSENVDKNLLLDLDVLSKDAPDIEIINDIDN